MTEALRYFLEMLYACRILNSLTLLDNSYLIIIIHRKKKTKDAKYLSVFATIKKAVEVIVKT